MQQYRTGNSVIFKVPEREIDIPVADLYTPTPGHRPDHAALILSSGGEYAFFAGESCGWLNIDRQGNYGWTEAGKNK
ncbi:hypothetical protein C7M51_00303 [Mixta intestinalis]|uniref:Uncharacterized protein n=1 Tax=Mixta intestinalis TaxID=1615494 RepID=A0A6P1PUS1_9GAMM|nr:hypothetical protein C7M51_00303 [Mixta intestinalis]